MSTLNAISQYFDCFDITLHLWSGRRMLKHAEVRLQSETLSEDKVTKPQAILLPQKWRDRFNGLSSAKSALMRYHSLPHIAPGMACVIRSNVPSFLTKLNTLRHNVSDVINDLKLAWDDEIVAWNRERWGDKFNDYVADGVLVPGVKRDLPNPDKLHKLIRLEWSTFSLEAGTAHVEAISNAEIAELAAETRRMTEQRINEFVEGLLEAPRQRMVEAIAGIRQLLAGGGRVTEKSFNQLRAAIALMRDFQQIPAVSDTAIVEQLRALEAATDALPRTRNDRGDEMRSLAVDVATETGAALVQAMDQVVATCTDEATVSRQIGALANARMLALFDA